MDFKKNKAGSNLYKYGWLGLFPIIGIIPGIILLSKGIKFKNRILYIIGIADISLAIFVCVVAFTNIFGAVSKGKNMDEYVIRRQLRLSVQAIEYYRSKSGSYPDSLNQVHLFDRTLPVYEPNYFFKRILFNYNKVDSGYILYSSGLDGIANTKDDIYPDLSNTDVIKIGLIQDTNIIKRSFGK
jgi:hypothetical protein